MDKSEITSISLPVSASISKHLQSNCQEMKANANETQGFYIRYCAALICSPFHRQSFAQGEVVKTRAHADCAQPGSGNLRNTVEV